MEALFLSAQKEEEFIRQPKYTKALLFALDKKWLEDPFSGWSI